MDVCKAFTDALEEEGLDADVSHSTNHAKLREEFTVTKSINGETVKSRRTLTFDPSMDEAERKKIIAIEAGTVARSFRDRYTERLEWGDNVVEFDAKSTYTARCMQCGSEVCVDDLRDTTAAVSIAESTVPNPIPPDYESLSTLKKQLALLALLRDECDPICHRNI
jgi:hypothetical protein